jgi:hypothetical protein
MIRLKSSKGCVWPVINKLGSARETSGTLTKAERALNSIQGVREGSHRGPWLTTLWAKVTVAKRDSMPIAARPGKEAACSWVSLTINWGGLTCA